MVVATCAGFGFGPFEIYPEDRTFLREGDTVKLRGKDFDVLAYLVAKHGRLVRYNELISHVWESAIESGNLTTNVSHIRKALDQDDPKSPKYIRTVTGHGYTFIAEVHPIPATVAHDLSTATGEEQRQIPLDQQLELRSNGEQNVALAATKTVPTSTNARLASPAAALTPTADSFFLAALPSDPEIIEFVTHAWSIDKPTEISPLFTTAEVDQQVRNSNRWLLRGRTDYFLRQILRKIPANADRLASKHRLLWWLKHKFEFCTECPIRPIVALGDWRYCWAVPSASGAPFELYPLVRGGIPFDQQGNNLDLLVELLVKLNDATQRLFSEDADLAESLICRLTRFCVRPHYEQIETSLVSIAKELQVMLTSMQCPSDVEAVSEEMIGCFASNIDDSRFRLRIERLREKQPQRLLHGDMTENNLLIRRKQLWLFDWDNVSIQQSGPFDLAFALVRLVNADRMGASLYPTSEEKQGAERLIKLYNDASSSGVSDGDMALALEQVRFEFSLRMLEYFEMLVVDPSRPVDLPYVRRCNPGRPLAIRRHLIGDKL